MRGSPIAFTLTAACVVAALMPATTAQAAAVTCHGVKATIVGTSGSDVIHGTTGRDVIAGLGGSDTIYAGPGNDIVCGGYGDDHLYGGAGNDTLYGDQDRLHSAQEDGMERIGDTLRGGPGDDRLFAGVDKRTADLYVYDTFAWDKAANGVHIDLRSNTATGEGSDRFYGGTFNIVGSSHSDVIDGSDHRDRIYAGLGPDVVRAHGGSDIVYADDTPRTGGPGADADKVWGGAGNDDLRSGRGQDRLSGGPGNDRLEDMGASNDELIGGKGDDMLTGQIWDADKPQSFNGGQGFDTLDLYSDRLNHAEAASTGTWNMATGKMTFTLGQDKVALTAIYIDRAIFVSPGTRWTVTGTSDDDMFSGATGTAGSMFSGLAGDDTFRGSDGDDTFNGGPGQDHSLGMFDGDDTCISVETIDGNDCEHVS